MKNKVISVFTNFTIFPHFNDSIKEYFKYEVTIQYFGLEDFENKTNDIISSDIVLVWINFEIMFPNLYNDLLMDKVVPSDVIENVYLKCTNMYQKITQDSTAKIIWVSFEDYYLKYDEIFGTTFESYGIVDALNDKLKRIFGNMVSFLDLKHVISKISIECTYDYKNKYRWNIVYTKELIEKIAFEVHKQFLISRGITKKCLILDCDNVLWGGVVSELGIEKIKLGQAGKGRQYQQFQREVLTLYNHGVILAICSKNDFIDVVRVFNEHTGMILNEDHISHFQVNWTNKVDNIKKISSTLNIGLDSMVFVDDSEFEIRAVRSMLPQVKCVKFDMNCMDEIFKNFNLPRNIDKKSIKKRNETYKTNKMREQIKLETTSLEEFVTKLQIKIDIRDVKSNEISRVSELTQRTNKCTNGKRYKIEDIKNLLESEDYFLYSVYVKDKFSDLGLVGVMGIRHGYIDLFALSCRALGRNIEKKMIDFIRSKGIVSYEFFETGKNYELKKLFDTI